ncbi:Ldh family oxidoreductase [Thermodesulforhabdus norvegica]|uniref:Malate/lactate/ureidoglycolate dehydrogenase, LDH2 family n=1 Tax=Thermodesulforhabdus norvegica TaxID=39841 RepID=A0A1I4VWT0_9BACT|nr:Ldh family oxidoreductase [Thermodesulforhabdus norvegica]SFN05721.1 Malate/lactate/ureidoglycolate dehydrogenase, LDH2 family [Thermodesulforhabdus norvegica]
MRVRKEVLLQGVSKILQALGASEEEAAITTGVLVEADMRGISTHGCVYVPLIANRVKAGVLQLPTTVRVIKDENALAHLDGGNGLGPVAAFRAMAICIEKARRYGVGFALVRNTNHIGFLGYYTHMAALEGMFGLCMTNAAPSMAPWGGAEPIMGSNPISMAVPWNDDDTVVLDMSSSVVARGKIRQAARRGEAIPPGWALDSEGRPTTDAGEALKGTLLPIGGPKGYGLAFFVDVIAGILSGSQFGPFLRTFHKPLGPTGVGAAFMALDISRVMPLEKFRSTLSLYADIIRNSRKARGVERIFLPGEIEAERARHSLKNGIAVDDRVIDSLNRLLEEKGISFRIEGEENGKDSQGQLPNGIMEN